MLAQLLRRPRSIDLAPLTIEAIEAPAPGPGELRLRLEACAVCRTDLQIVEGDLALHRAPLVPGHQAVGIVEAIGPGVEGWAAGDRAGVGWLGDVCGACEYCTTGRENLCESATFTGWDRDGGYAQAMLVRAGFALRLPAALEAEALAPLLCGGVIGYRSLRVSGIGPGQRLGLYGFGASASLAIQVAVHMGCEVFVVTRSTEEQRRARALGAAWAGTLDEQPPARLHAAVTFAPVGEVVLAALRALAPGGTVAINAIHLDRVPEFSYDWLWRERSLRSVANFTRADAREFVALAAEIPLRTETQPFALAEANEALRALRQGELRGTAVLMIE
ncbi:MAG TPA: zinc-dependent alcohol dehydrogenase family protein [Dehalococcoidia bacterium]|nr:zinc-dependent alcohol dehydrogenase family protein [Dehalococcoidia bacterium]